MSIKQFLSFELSKNFKIFSLKLPEADCYATTYL